MNRKFKKQHLFKIEMFYNIINVTFDRFIVSLLNQSKRIKDHIDKLWNYIMFCIVF